MAGVTNEQEMSLKILVDVKAQKVVFAEAGKDFVDFIFDLLKLPLSSVTKLLNDKTGMVGCFGAIYRSIESLDAKYYVSNLNKDSILKPRTAAIVPVLSLNDAPTKISFYRCGSGSHPNCICISDSMDATCQYCSYRTSSEFSLTYVSPKSLDYKAAGYVKGVVPYIVMDNLEVKPMSLSLIKSLVKDFDSLEEKRVKFGQEEGLALLKASLEKEDVLTTVYLGKKIVLKSMFLK